LIEPQAAVLNASIVFPLITLATQCHGWSQSQFLPVVGDVVHKIGTLYIVVMRYASHYDPLGWARYL
jgi:hypothetical protein